MRVRPKLTSPADIYEQFAQIGKIDTDDKPLKSILKKDSRSNSNENLRLKPILKTSPEHRPGTPEHVIDEPRPILKTPPDSQGSDHRPGTPEYIFLDGPRPILKTYSDGGEYRSKTPDSYGEEPRHSILKTQEVHFVDQADLDSDTAMADSNNEETRSILKTTSDNPSCRPVSKNVSLDNDHKTPDSYGDEPRHSILKTQEVHFADEADYTTTGVGSVASYNSEETRSILKSSSDNCRPVTPEEDQKGIMRTTLKSLESSRSDTTSSTAEPRPILKNYEAAEVKTLFFNVLNKTFLL